MAYFRIRIPRVLIGGAIVFLALVAVYFLVFSSGKQYRSYGEFEANSTDYMVETVEGHLSGVDCQPDSFYYRSRDVSGQQVCFPCGDFDACFGYRMVTRESGQLMNPYSPHVLIGDYQMIDLLNFQSEGIAEDMNCECVDGECTCDGGAEIVLREGEIYFIVPPDRGPEGYVQEVSDAAGYPTCTFNDRGTVKQASCGGLSALIQGGNEIFLMDAG